MFALIYGYFAAYLDARHEHRAKKKGMAKVLADAAQHMEQIRAIRSSGAGSKSS